MVNIVNCRKCGRIFNYVVGPRICPACREENENTFQRVKKYVEEHPEVTIVSLAEECEVEPQQIQQWLREERLELKSGSGIALPCESCGAPITSGRYCDKCKHELAKGFGDAIRNKQQTERREAPLKPKDDGNRMRFLCD